MKERKFALLLIGLCGVLVASGYALTYPEKFKLCDSAQAYSCINFYAFNFGEPLFSGILFGLLPVSILLLIFPAAFRRWWVCARIYIPISILLIAFAPASGGSGGLPGWDKEVTTWFVAGLYVAISIGIIGYDSYLRRRIMRRDATNL